MTETITDIPVNTVNGTTFTSHSTEDAIAKINMLMVQFAELSKKLASLLQDLKPEQLENQYNIRLAGLEKQLDAIDLELKANNFEAAVTIATGIIGTLGAFGGAAGQTAGKGLTEIIQGYSKSQDITFGLGNNDGQSINEMRKAISEIKANAEFINTSGQSYDKNVSELQQKIAEVRQQMREVTQQLQQLLATLENSVRN